MSIHGTQQGYSLRIDTSKTGELWKQAESMCSIVLLLAANPKDAEEAAEPMTEQLSRGQEAPGS